MSSLDIAASASQRRDETVLVALLLAYAGGYIDAYTWINHGVMANAQTANLVLLWVYGTMGNWDKARRSRIFAALCVVFGLGAAVGAFATKGIPDLALGIPVIALLIVLLRCEVRHEAPT